MTDIPMMTDDAVLPTAVLLLAHGSGLPMDSPFMTAMAEQLASHGITVLRFEFPYMADRRRGGSKRPPPKAEKLCAFYSEAIAQARCRLVSEVPLLIGGKSLGGRVASLISEAAYEDGEVQGLVCFGYPFHPPGKPTKLRTAHLQTMKCPSLICQGTRDPLGTREEIASYDLDQRVEFCWVPDGDHDFKPRKRSGVTIEENVEVAASRTATFAKSLSDQR